MSPLAGALVVLVLVLVAAGAWYERTRPSARVVALVATLAALAALGRIAFAPVPSVKPTTDIVLLAGYALGGAPGFAVGAIAALASNVVFGQGPWTPWQMVGWGLCGLLGAGLARVTARAAGRIALAACGALAGLLFGALMNVSTWLLTAPSTGAAGYLATSATALPYDLVHAGANAAFALLVGPELARGLARFRARTDGGFGLAPVTSERPENV